MKAALFALVAPSLLLLVGACASMAPPAPPPSVCQAPGGQDYLDVQPVIARQSATLRLMPRRDMAPGGTEPVPIECTSGWSISDPALATLSADHRSLRIAPNARPGAELVVHYVVRMRPVEARLRIVGSDQIVLIGTRSQTGEEGCEGGSRIGEIAFGPDRFAITFHPFESYNDYWGTYRFDAATGALVLTVEGGNYTPPGLDLEGTARFDASGRLVLDGFYLGAPQGEAGGGRPCRYIFG